MADELPLHPATGDEIAQALAFALQYNGRKRVHDAANAMARITADRLVLHLELSGFVLMKRPSRDAPTTSGMPHSTGSSRHNHRLNSNYSMGCVSE